MSGNLHILCQEIFIFRVNKVRNLHISCIIKISTDEYVGGVVNGHYHKKGKLINDLGCYDGNWEYGQKSGYGKFIGTDGIIYDGQWWKDKYHGFGTWWSSCECYNGNWRNGVREGFGKMSYSNGDTYQGAWLNDLRHGSGRYTNSDGTIVAGVWKDDIFQRIYL